MKLSLDVIGYNHKPESYEARMINNRICQYPVSLGLKEIADEIAHNGKTFCPAVFNGKRNKECFQQAQLIGLDYDGGITFPEVLERCKYYDLNIAFAYETFSSTKENQKFRVVFCLDGIIQHSNIYELIVSLLLKVFPEADSACRDCSRIFYGSNKGLLYNSEEICLIPNIVRAGDICMHNKNGHFARDIKRLAVKYGVSITDNRIIIQEAKMGDFSPNAYIIYKEDGKKTPIYEIMSNNITNNNYFGVSIAPQTQKYSKTHKTYRNIIEQMTERCQMMKDSLDIETFADMTHDEHMCIMTNLIHVEGGKSFFMDLINRSGSDLEKWKYDWKWWEISGKGPYHCKSHCKYCSKCNNAGTILDTAIRKIKHAGLEDRCSLDDALDDLKDQFKRAMDPKRSNNKIHLIKAQTGLGKTMIYTQYVTDAIKNNMSTATGRKFIIAVPTNDLKEEVYDRLIKLDPTLESNILKSVAMEELPYLNDIDKGELMHLYDVGYSDRVLKKIKKINKKGISSDEYKKYDRFLHFSRYCESADVKIIITTHSKLLNMDKKYIKDYDVIIDEDILKTMVRSIKRVNTKDIDHLLLYENINKETQDLLNLFLKLPIGSCMDSPGACRGIRYKMIEENDMESNFQELKRGSVVLRDSGYCVYFNPVKFDWDTNIVILSATADDKLYKEYFNDRIFEVHQVRKATYSGIVKQYTKYPLSRNAIFKIDRKILYKHVRKITGECPIITFKSIKKKKKLLHFGNTEGIDIYKGKTIAVMGTPYPYPGEVVLWYYLLRHKYPDKQCNFYNNQYGSYTFCSYCYKDELMRRIQTYLIVSELEQAVGRARLLRNNCTVYVFSNYPVDQAIIYADPYLEDKS